MQTKKALAAELGRRFKALVLGIAAEEGQDGLKRLLEGWEDEIDPAIRPILLRACSHRAMKQASRAQLLAECETLGIVLWKVDVPDLSSYGPDPATEYELRGYDLNELFSGMDKGLFPWNRTRPNHEGMVGVHETLQALIDYHRVHGELPRQQCGWILRCSTRWRDSTLAVEWDPGYGLRVRFLHGLTSRGVACLFATRS